MREDKLIGSTWRHVNTGRVYALVGKCRLEHNNAPAYLYRRTEDGITWARDMDEFLDGRFERISFSTSGKDWTTPSPKTSLYQLPCSGDWINPLAVRSILIRPAGSIAGHESPWRVLITDGRIEHVVRCEDAQHAGSVRAEIASAVNLAQGGPNP